MLVDVKELESEYFEMVVALGDIILLVEDLKKTTSDNERKAVIQNIEDFFFLIGSYFSIFPFQWQKSLKTPMSNHNIFTGMGINTKMRC